MANLVVEVKRTNQKVHFEYEIFCNTDSKQYNPNRVATIGEEFGLVVLRHGFVIPLSFGLHGFNCFDS